MRLPNREVAIVDRRKVVDYLLNAAHPDNGGKSAFFEALGFVRSEPESLVDALRMISSGDVVHRSSSEHGDKYVIDGSLASPAARVGRVRTIWIVDAGTMVPRFVTAYPRE